MSEDEGQGHGLGEWDQAMSQEEWDRFEAEVREQVVDKMVDSALVTTLNPAEQEPDVKLAVEVGMTILLDKPMLLIAREGDYIPPMLERVAHAVIRHSGDLASAEGKEELWTALKPFLEEFSNG